MNHTNSPFGIDAIMEALPRVRAEFTPTPLSHSIFLSEIVGHDVFIKWENKLRTGSFKERGAINFIATLSEEERRKGLCAASAGNHAMALSYYAQKANVPCTIVMPKWAPLIKMKSTAKFGARVISFGLTFDDAYQHALELSRTEGCIFVPGFDDYKIIAGQGTAGLEILDQLSDFDSVIVPIGGGGLISGIAEAVKATRPGVDIIGVQSEWITARRKSHNTTFNSALAPQTIAEGIAIKTIGTKNAQIIKERVTDIVTVTESQIAEAIVKLLELEKTVAEGAGAAGVAALPSKLIPSTYKRSVAVVCGSNIDMDVMSRLIMRDMSKRNRLLRLAVSVPDRPGSLHFLSSVIAEEGANVIEVTHDRSFSEIPGNVSISFVLEVRDKEHKDAVGAALVNHGISFSIA